MKKLFALLFTIVLFLGAVSMVSAAACETNADCSGVTPYCNNSECSASNPNGFGITLMNPLCPAGPPTACSPAVPQCIGVGSETLAGCCSLYGATVAGPSCVSDFPGLISAITNFISGLIASIAMLVIVWAGFLYVTSAGNPGKITTAKNALIWAIVGIAIALAGSGLVAVITQVIGNPPT